MNSGLEQREEHKAVTVRKEGEKDGEEMEMEMELCRTQDAKGTVDSHQERELSSTWMSWSMGWNRSRT